VAEQKAAEDAVRAGVVNFNRRRDYPGPEAWVALPQQPDEREKVIDDALSRDDVNGMVPAIVTVIDKNRIQVRLRGGDVVDLGPSELKFAATALSVKTPVQHRLQVGSLVRVVQLGKGSPWQLTYLPSVEAAMVALDPNTGAITALVGGFDYSRNQYNHIIQAWRQPGSSFKPFIYSAALDKGITPATVFDDGPINIPPEQTGGQLWDPKNYDNEQDGPITVRTALARSNNLASIRLLQATGPDYAQAYAMKFGFSPDRIQPYLTMALGAGEVTPLQLVRAYAAFASGGMLPNPFYLQKITDQNGKILQSFKPVPAERVIDARNAYIMTSMLQGVVRTGTAAAASSLGRADLAGKTGTTNDQRDAWFAGFDSERVAVAWVGYDQPKPLGRGETGARAALPIWMDYMSVALHGVPDTPYPMPDGIVTINVDPITGNRVAEGGKPEYFLQEFQPPEDTGGLPIGGVPADASGPFIVNPMVSKPAASPAATPEAKSQAKPQEQLPAKPQAKPEVKQKSTPIQLPGTQSGGLPGVS